MEVVKIMDDLGIRNQRGTVLFESIDEAIRISNGIAEKVRELRPCEDCAFYSGRPYAECEDCDDDFNSMWKLKEKPIKGQRDLIKKALETALDNHEVNQPQERLSDTDMWATWYREWDLFKNALTALEKEGL